MKKLKSVYRTIDVKVFLPSPYSTTLHWPQKAAEGRAYTSENIEQVLVYCKKELEKRFPSLTFQRIKLGPNRFNFVHQPIVTIQ
jgi:hypothetical protein